MTRTARFLTLALGVALAPAPAAQDLVLTNGHIVDPARRAVVEGGLWIRDGKIAGVGSVPADATGERIESVRRLAAAGVPMLTGTDAGNVGVVQGYSVHRELVWLVAAGLTPWDALRASTTNAGKFLGRAYGVGPGHQADLVVLDASPLEDIANTQTIGLVVMRGRVVYRR